MRFNTLGVSRENCVDTKPDKKTMNEQKQEPCRKILEENKWERERKISKNGNDVERNEKMESLSQRVNKKK